MPATPSTMLELGTPMPSFRLPDAGGAILSSEQFRGAAGLPVVFICPQGQHRLQHQMEAWE